MEWNIALLGQALIVFIFDWQNLNMIISIFNLSHTNTSNGTPTRATPGRQRALQKPMAAGRSSERTESERVTTGFRRGAEREYTMHTERSEIGETGDKFCICTYWYIFYITPKFIYSFYQRICLLHRIKRIFDIIYLHFETYLS